MLAQRALGLQLTGDEPDGDDLELLGGIQQPHSGALACRLVFERDLAEADESVADMRWIVDRQPSLAGGVDVGEGPVGKSGSLLRVEAGHALTIPTACYREGLGVCDSPHQIHLK